MTGWYDITQQLQKTLIVLNYGLSLYVHKGAPRVFNWTLKIQCFQIEEKVKSV